MTLATVTRCKHSSGLIATSGTRSFTRRRASGPLTVALTVLLLALTHLAAMAATWYVSTTGTDSNGGTSWSSPLATVAKAISMASFNDQVWIKEGTYTLASQINLVQGVSVYGGFNGTETMLSQRNWVANVTILNGNSSTRIAYATSNITKSTYLDGFTLMDGHAVAASSNGGYGGGVYCDGSPTISNDIFDGCSASQYGGAIYCSSTSAAVIGTMPIGGNGGGNTFQANSAGVSGGAIEDSGDIAVSNSSFLGNSASGGNGGSIDSRGGYGGSMTVSGNTFEGNYAQNGGAIYFGGILLSVLSSTFEGNSAMNDGGAIWANSSTSVSISGNTILSNTAGSAGGIYTSGGSPLISDNIVTLNQATQSAYYQYGGGGIYCSGGAPTITNNTISQNTTASYGGGILLLDCGGSILNNTENSPGGAGISGNTALVGGGISCYYYSGYYGTPTISANAIHGNSAPQGGGIYDDAGKSFIANNHVYANFASNDGAGIYEGATTSTLQGNVVELNGSLPSTTPPTETPNGGGIYIYQGSPVLTNNLVLNNIASLSGAGIEINNSTATLANNTICSPNVTTTGTGVGAIQITATSASPSLANNVVAFNVPGGIVNQGGGPVTLSHNDVYGNTGFNYSGLTPDNGSIMADPIFINGYHIVAGSPCVNAGDLTYVTGGEVDLDGNPRSRDGVHVDIGCYEYTSAATGLVGFTLSSNMLYSQVTATGKVTLAAPAPSGGTTVFLSSGDSLLVAVPPTVVVPATKTSATFTLTAGITATTQSTTLYAALNGTVLTVNITVSPLLQSVSFNPIEVIGGSTSQGGIILNCPAPSGGVTINLSSSDPSVSVPASVTVAAGNTGATFKAVTSPTTVLKIVTITATNGIESAAGTLYVDPAATLSALTISSASVIGSESVVGIVTLKSAAPAGGVDVALSVNDPIASVPTVVTVPAGRTQGKFQIDTTAVPATQTISITASLGSVSKSAKLTVNPITVATVTLSPKTISKGEDAFFIVTLTAPAGPGGVTVTLSSDNLSVAAPDQPTLVIPAGQWSGAAYIDTYADGVADIGATLAGITKTAKLTVKN